MIKQELYPLAVRSVRAQLYVNLTDFNDIIDEQTLRATLDGSISAKDLLERLLLFKELGYTWDSFLKESEEDEITIKPVFEKIAHKIKSKYVNCNICGKQGLYEIFDVWNPNLEEFELVCPVCGSLSVQEI